MIRALAVAALVVLLAGCASVRSTVTDSLDRAVSATSTAALAVKLASAGHLLTPPAETALGDALTLDGSLRWTRIGGDEGGTGLDASVGLRWQIAAPWSLSAQWFENRGPQRSPFVLDPLTNQLVQLRLPNDRTLFFSLRYEFRQGRLQPVLGGPPNAAFGSIAGSVFLDDNNDGVRSASEQPAVNVTVLLDGRYTARTDSQGRFEFQRVATGRHEITVVPDNLPLPWFLEGEAATRTVEVRVREAARVDLGARRDR